MVALVLGLIALASVMFSFALAALTILVGRKPPESVDAPEDATTTMSRVIGDVERLAVLRDRGALTEKEFAAQKTKVLGPSAPLRSRR